VEPVGAEPALDERLARGDVDALMTARLPRHFVAGDGRVRRLFKDHRRVEASYFARTGIFPPMHVIVVRRELYEAEPWIGPSLFSSFVAAKRLGLANAYEIDVSRHSLAWWVSYLEEERRLLGDDPWTYGVEPNRHTVETFVGYCHSQGLISRRLAIEEIFPDNLLEMTG
jgi:4,5-dihydroxyphthalate decarboxylase